jgi:hypothetical protein
VAHGVDLLLLVLGAGLAAGAFAFARRYGGGAALEQLKRSNRVLAARVTELETQNREQARELTKLRLETNVASAIAPVLTALAHHEERAAERSVKTLDLLQLMADHLGREPEAEAA